MPSSAKDSSTPRTRLTPSSRLSWVRKTDTSVCITFCMSERICAVDLGPEAVRTESRTLMLSAPASAGMSMCGWPGLNLSRMVWLTARPKTMRSRREFAPRRFAPCTETQAASPQAKRPGTTLSVPDSSTVRTSPVYLVGMPPML